MSGDLEILKREGDGKDRPATVTVRIGKVYATVTIGEWSKLIATPTKLSHLLGTS